MKDHTLRTNDGMRVVTNPEQGEIDTKVLNVITESIDRLLSLTTSHISLYMPITDKHRGKHLLKVLLSIRALKQVNKTNLILRYNYHATIIKDLKYLHELGLIALKEKPRLVPCFGRHIVTNNYVITAKGEKVLMDIFCS